MRGRAVRRVPERSMEVEAVVSYSLIPPDGDKPAGDNDGRVEPRLTILPIERRVRSAEIAAPSSEEAAEHGARFEARPIDPLPPDPSARRRRRPGVAIVGAVAVLIGFGVLAATFGKVMTGNAPAVTETATEPPAPIALEPPPPATEDTAGPGVRIIAPDGNTGTGSFATDAAAPPSAAAPSTDAAAPPATSTATLEAAPAPSAAPANPPLPRLRPTTPTVASLPPPTAGQPVAIATPAAPGDDVGAMMSDIDRILAQHKAETPPVPAPLALPTATADAGPLTITGPAPLDNLVPPPPVRRGWFLYPDTRDATGMPVPPADIPDPEGAPGQ